MLEAQKLIASAFLLMQGANAQFKGAARKTEDFASAPGTFFDPKDQPISGHGFAGIIIGVVVMSIFFIYVGFMIIKDERLRTKYYADKVKAYENKLSSKYGMQMSEITDLKNDFDAQDEGEGRKKEQEE